MKYFEVFLLGCLAALAGYTLCAWSPKPHLVQVIDQGKPMTWKGAGEPREQEHTGQQDSQGDGSHTLPAKPASRQSEDWAPFQIIDARDPLIVALGQAIAREEGFGKPGTLATRLHNPGMLVWAAQKGALLPDEASDTNVYALFETDDAGWAALYADLRAKKATGKVDCEAIHREYGHNMSVDECRVWEIAYNWSTGDREKYARDVVADLKARGLLR